MGGGTRLFCESYTSVSVVRTKKNQNRPAFETVLVVLDVFCPQKIFVAEMVMEAGKSKACGNYGSTPICASQLLSMLIGC